MLDRLFDWLRAREEVYVKAPHRVRWIAVVDLLFFAVTLTAWVIWPAFHGTPLGVVLGVVVGLQLGRTALLGIRRAMSFRRGWLDGRVAMMHSMEEAARHGMSLSEWSRAELSRDLHIAGVDDDEADELIRRMGEQ